MSLNTLRPAKGLRLLAPLTLVAALSIPAAASPPDASPPAEATPSCHGAQAATTPVEGGGHRHHPGPAPDPATEAAGAPAGRLRVPDADLLNQDGEEIRLYSDLVKGRVVAINFIFTTCTTICPPMGANFSRLQDELGDHLGRDVQLLSVSIDPTTDTPQRLKAWGEKFSASGAWTLVTGPKPDVDQVLRELEVLPPDVQDHGPVVLLVDDRRGTWRRVNGLTPPNKLAAMLTEMLEAGSGSTEEATR